MDFLQSLLAPRLQNVETSAIRELFKVLGKPGLISFAGGFPDSTLFDVEGLKAAADNALATDAARALQYGATEGFEPLREAIVTLMQTRGATVANTDILVTTGSQQGLDLLGKVLIGEGDTVLTEAPTFLAAIQAFKLYGAKVAGVPTDEDGLDLDALERTLAAGRPKFLYVIPNFGNPSGALMSLERRRRLLEMAVRHNLLIVEDDPYGELYFDAPPPPSLFALSEQIDGAQGRVIYLGSLSKVVAPGLRVGWMIAPSAVLSNAVMVKQFADAHTSTFAQATAAAYLRSQRMETVLPRTRAAYAERAHAMADGLRALLPEAELTFNRPRGGMFLWGRLPGRNAADVAKIAIERGVAFVPGAAFYPVDPDRSTLRLSYATSSLAQVEEGVRKLAGAIGELAIA
ncbi:MULTISPECIES: PLP-dependent aminotransferase family protein [Ralstonia solanacearum species complex]|uniref:aminotransferase-like domain-containing protein n=1 Tax=Ralstonia solanacearum species complex TaxID=3116862 RepID=UPI00078D5F9A|nr:PLP-dependent aminotransferase family protein [Ralstonia solanacearum]BEU73424.1 PLP-dependent aminotransferase family protein [Ralstonia pseudosolanacearum]AMP38830.1 aspartate aminotransferase [Ralstonia solanacearum]AXV78214.1 PLP-dependent aminotransferase family protein [Ralstonia solanacearum]AXV87658.1 PLP-dependent aminotransferase family protein [Ralstonia solanacearum]AXV92237.1 PLP-dependent aminotransferase family protein [Ralstonia solanacearum]